MLHAAGRTDAGVHALAMAAHVDIARAITPFRLAEGLNARLRPLPVAILKAEAGRRRLARPLQLHRPALPLPDRQPPGAAGAGGGPRLAGGGAARRRGDARSGAAAGRPARFHHLPLRPLPVGEPGQDARPARRAAARARRSRSRRRRAPSSTTRCARWSAACSWSGAANGRRRILKAALEARDRAALGLNAPPDGLYFVAALYPERLTTPKPNRR